MTNESSAEKYRAQKRDASCTIFLYVAKFINGDELFQIHIVLLMEVDSTLIDIFIIANQHN